jgi:hemoglobin
MEHMEYHELDRAGITAFVHRFYGRVREDAELAPIFLGAIGDDWEPHLERMFQFWSTVMLGTREFDGNVFGKHMQLEGVQPHHFRRWLDAFRDTALALFPPALAEELMLPARRIAGSLQYGYFGAVTHQ